MGTLVETQKECYRGDRRPTYVKRMLKNYEQMFGEPPKEELTPLAKDDRPELDMTPELDLD